MTKRKLIKFEENKKFPNMFQPPYHEVIKGFKLKGKWNNLFFGNDHPIVLELGCGKGDYTVGLAKKYPEKNFIGIDIKGSRMWKGCKYSNENRILNTAFVRTRIDLIEHIFEPAEVNEIWIPFPDPQPKKSRKRLTSPLFLNRYRNILQSENIIHLKTDNKELFEYTLNIIKANGHELLHVNHELYNQENDAEASDIRTFYEIMWLEEGRTIQYLCFRLDIGVVNHQPMPDSNSKSFFEQVYEVVKQIPHGRVTSYGAIAGFLGSRGSARMVGWAMNASHTSTLAIPAHRVVNRNGVLTGKRHFGGPLIMQQLLENEGLLIQDDQIINFQERFWDPAKELKQT